MSRPTTAATNSVNTKGLSTQTESYVPTAGSGGPVAPDMDMMEREMNRLVAGVKGDPIPMERNIQAITNAAGGEAIKFRNARVAFRGYESGLWGLDGAPRVAVQLQILSAEAAALCAPEDALRLIEMKAEINDLHAQRETVGAERIIEAETEFDKVFSEIENRETAPPGMTEKEAGQFNFNEAPSKGPENVTNDEIVTPTHERTKVPQNHRQSPMFEEDDNMIEPLHEVLPTHVTPTDNPTEQPQGVDDEMAVLKKRMEELKRKKSAQLKTSVDKICEDLQTCDDPELFNELRTKLLGALKVENLELDEWKKITESN